MKKRFLSILLVLCMVFTLFPQTALAENAGDVTKDDTAIGVSSVVDSGGCICMVLCTNDQRNPDCKSCSAVGMELAAMCVGKAPEPELLTAEPQVLSAGAGYSYDSVNKILTVSSNTGIREWRENAQPSGADIIAVKEVQIESSVTSIIDGAFLNCTNLISITMTDSIGYIGEDAFRECRSLKRIKIPYNISSIEPYTFYGCKDLESITFPIALEYIGAEAFRGCTSLKSVSAPSLLSIGKKAFYDCVALEKIDMSNRIETIGDEAFYGCINLPSVTFAPRISSIGGAAFINCDKLTKATFLGKTPPENIASLVFSNNLNFKIYVPSGAADAYKAVNNLHGYTIEEETTAALGYNYDSDAKALTVLTNAGVGNWRAAGSLVPPSEIETVMFGPMVSKITENAFYRCSALTQIYFSKVLVEIGTEAFYGCQNLTDVTLVSGLVVLGQSAFESCSKLTSFTFYTDNPPREIGTNVFRDTAADFKIFVPANSGPQYRAEKNLKDYTIEELIIPPPAGNGYSYDLAGTLTLTSNEGTTRWRGHIPRILPSDITTVKIGPEVTQIGAGAFQACENLISIDIPSHVTVISRSAFEKCTRLKSVVLPNDITELGDAAFLGCTSLESVTLPSELKIIGGEAFKSCENLKSITFPAKLTYIVAYAFKDCTKLASATFEGITPPIKIAVSAFENTADDFKIYVPADSLAQYKGVYGLYGYTIMEAPGTPRGYSYDAANTTLTITTNNGTLLWRDNPDIPTADITTLKLAPSVTAIKPWGFSSCNGLKSVSIPAGITSIGEYAFTACKNLRSVTFEGETPPLSVGFSVFDSTTRGLKIYVPAGKVAAYKAVPGFLIYTILESGGPPPGYNFDWENKTMTISTNAGTTEWRDDFTIQKSEVVTVVIMSGVTSIDDGAFKFCPGLKSVTIPEGVISIGEHAFRGCEKLAEVTFPDTLKTIDSVAFGNCTILNNVTFPANIQTIGESAFYKCVNLINVTFEGMAPPVTFGYNVFDGANSALKIHVPAGKTDVYKAKLTGYKDKIVAAGGDPANKITSSLNLAGITSEVKCTDSNVGAKITGMTPHTHATSRYCWSWSGCLKTLTLNNVEIAVTVGHGVTLPAHATLEMSGYNKVSTTARNGCGIYSNSDKPNSTFIWGMGKLDVSGEYGISVGSGSLTISGFDPAINATAINGDGIKAGSLKILNGTVNATAINGDGIKAGSLEILNGTVNALGNQYGIRVDEGDIVLGNSGGSGLLWVKAQGETSALSKAPILKPDAGFYTTTGAWDAKQASWVIPQGAPDDDSGGGSIGGDGGSSDGGGSTSPTGGTTGGAATPGKTVIDNPVGAQGSANILTEAVKNALATGKTSQTVYINFANYTALTKEGLKAINDAAAAAVKGENVTLNIKVQLDNMVGNAVVSRITVDPAKLAAVMPEKLPLGIYFDQQKDAKVQAVRNRFEKAFDNSMVVVTFEQTTPLQASMELAAKPDMTGLNTKSLYFYSYNPTTNLYYRIWSPGYWVDTKGYTHFTAPFGGSVIITDKPLTKK